MAEEPCLYAVLRVAPTATAEEVRRAYMVLARRYHPDKGFVANPQGMDGTPDGLSDHDMFSLVARAYEVLVDPTKRATYDLLHGHAKEDAYARLREMRRKDAEHAVALMKVSFDVRRRQELARGGLVVDDAVYGPRNLIEGGSLDDLSTSELVVNVTRQLQCLVEDSKLILPAGEPKHRLITGVYDPAMGEEKLLWVRYYFRGKLHRAIFRDTQKVLMPLKSHSSLAQRAAKRQALSPPAGVAAAAASKQTVTKRTGRGLRLRLAALAALAALGLAAARKPQVARQSLAAVVGAAQAAHVAMAAKLLPSRQ